MTVTALAASSPPARSAGLPAALASATRGIRDAESALDRDARSIATDGPQLATMTDLVVQPKLVAIDAKAVRTLDETAGSLLDLLA